MALGLPTESISLIGQSAFFALALTAYPLGVAPEKRWTSRCFTSVMLALLLSDILFSAFDGRWEVNKRIRIGSMCSR